MYTRPIKTEFQHKSLFDLCFLTPLSKINKETKTQINEFYKYYYYFEQTRTILSFVRGSNKNQNKNLGELVGMFNNSDNFKNKIKIDNLELFFDYFWNNEFVIKTLTENKNFENKENFKLLEGKNIELFLCAILDEFNMCMKISYKNNSNVSVAGNTQIFGFGVFTIFLLFYLFN